MHAPAPSSLNMRRFFSPFGTASALAEPAAPPIWLIGFERGYSPRKYSLYKNAISPLAPLEPGLRIHIDPSTAQVFVADTKQPQAGKRDIRSILERTNKYNRDVARNQDAIARCQPIVTEVRDTVKGLIVTESVYQAANSLSVNFASKVRGSDAIIYSLALIAVVAFNLVSNDARAPWVYLGVTFAMALLAGRVLFFSVDNRFFEYRCLAEAMRTLFFWRAVGVTRPVWLACLSRQAGVVHWIRHGVRSVEFYQDCELSQRKCHADTGLDRLHLATACWVDDQKKWFSAKEIEHFRLMKGWKSIEYLALGASFVTAAVLALLTAVKNEEGAYLWDLWVKQDSYGNLWQVALGLFAAGGLAARGYLSRRAHLELTKQYASQRQIFEAASRTLDTIAQEPNPDWTAVQIFEKLGEEALQEQSEWVWLRHTRPFELPVP